MWLRDKLLSIKQDDYFAEREQAHQEDYCLLMYPTCARASPSNVTTPEDFGSSTSTALEDRIFTMGDTAGNATERETGEIFLFDGQIDEESKSSPTSSAVSLASPAG
jgi:hypothetical protein